jgi:hypothetical protein
LARAKSCGASKLIAGSPGDDPGSDLISQDSVSKENSMNRKVVTLIVLAIFAQLIGLSAAWQADARAPKAQYLTMAPLDQYLIANRDAEIAMARSAAPKSISGGAEVLVLGRKGYYTVVKGKNGFVCMVERSWSAGINDPDFWNPKLHAPICFNPPAVRSYLPITIITLVSREARTAVTLQQEAGTQTRA